MSRVLIGVELEGGRDTFLPGEEVSGLVRLSMPDGSVKCRKVTARLQWKTSGKGDTDKGGSEEVEIHPGPLLEGLVSVPFRLQIPLSPSSYNGILIKVSWCVYVRVDQPWAKDGTLEHPFTVA